jgi:tetratricopeptide (TPR) repeat protein
MLLLGAAIGVASAQVQDSLAQVRVAELVTTAWAEPAKHHCELEHFVANEADRAFVAQNYPAAEALYRKMLVETPGSEPVTAGVVRSELAQWKLTDALEMAIKASAAAPQSTVLMDVLGEVRLQRGEVDEAVTALNRALAMDACVARVHFDMGRYLGLKGMFASAQHQLDLAHELSPDDPSIGRAWTIAHATPLTPDEQVTRIMQRLEDPGLSAERRAALSASIRGIQAREKGGCRIETPVSTTRLKMAPLTDGAGLDVEVNGHRQLLKIDTGASGLLISMQAAVSAGLVPEAEVKTGGIGDSGAADAFVTHVDRLKIGGMEYRNCIVRVLEKNSGLDTDGLIGPDVFRDSVVTLDFPAHELRLSPLPQRPQAASNDETVVALATTGETTGRKAPEDRYIAPEMKNWTEIYRVGSQLIFPTRIGNAPLKLFLLDSGAARGIISPEAAREVTHVTDSDPDRAHIHGISGSVNTVYQAENVLIQFGGVGQVVERMTAIDTSDASRWAGVEISGFIGFPTLKNLIVSIDYRDNLVHVVYDAKHNAHSR